MAQKPVPGFIKEYMENIGHESFTDYLKLSNEYHTTKQVYHEFKFPRRIPASGRFTLQHQDVQADMYRMDEEFKSRALETACKYGYKDPGHENYDRDFTERQEDAYGNISRDDFDLSAEDIRAQKAHAVFEKEHPDKIADKQSNREIIEYYHSEPGKEQPQQPQKESQVKSVEEKAQKKEPLSREELKQSFSQNRDDITVTDRFLNSLRSGRTEPNDPGAWDLSKDKEDIEMERDM